MTWLETDRLLFRDHEPGDLEPYCAMESDPLYRAPQRVHPRAELERSFRHTWLVAKPLALRATVWKANEQYIGRCGLYPHRDDTGALVAGEAVLAFYLAREYWGLGIATEAGRAFVRHGFETLGLRRIHAGMNVENKASVRVIEKLGFTHVRSGEGAGNKFHDYELVNQLD